MIGPRFLHASSLLRAALLSLVCAVPLAAFGIEMDNLIDADPPMEIPQPIRSFDPAMTALWLSALERPETDMQRMAAETIARGHQFGVPGLTATVPRLVAILKAEKSHPAARFAAARALIVLESRESSEPLWNAAQHYGADLRQLVEPALADWEYGPAKDVWRKRLEDPAARRRDLVLALRGLARMRDASALSRFLAMTTDPLLDPSLRLEAAAAAGQAATTDLEETATRLSRDAQSPESLTALLAVRLLARHDAPPARQMLIELAGHAEPAVAAAALARLSEIDQTLILPLAESAFQSSDPKIRLLVAEACLNHPSIERVGPLAALLADAHPGVRRRVADGLFELSQTPEFLVPIQQAASEILSGDRWQGQEQAALLLGILQHQPSAHRLVELLESPRTEVAHAAAWSLRKVAVQETIPAILDKASRQTQRRRQMIDPTIDAQVAHLFEAIGVMRADAAVPLLVEYIPKQPIMGERSRSAAIWALGWINEGKRDPELEEALNDRINDFAEQKSESDLVKQMCAVTLVRMKALEAGPMLRGIIKSRPLLPQIGVAFRWAVRELTGEELPPPEPLAASHLSWFLEPLR